MASSPALEPENAVAAAAMLAHAAQERRRLVPQGHGTKSEPHVTPPAGTISTRRLVEGLSHYSGDLVATVPSGCTLHDVNAALGRERQWIPLDPPHAAGATIGGIVASNDSGPRRHAFGAPRDLVIGIEVALTSGSVAHSGGRVVKNVAGYDLGRLFCGSRGSLGLITSVTFKLAPVAAASRTVVARYLRPQQALAAALEISRTTSLTPTAIELTAPDTRLLVRFESTARAADLMAGSAAALCDSGATDVSILNGGPEQAEWEAHQHAESAPGGVEVSASVLPAAAVTLLDELEHVAAACQVRASLTGRAALGLLRVRFAGEPANLARAVIMTRDSAAKLGGHAQVAMRGALLGDSVDLHGPPGSAAAVAYAVKQRFDPAGVLPYPWAVLPGASPLHPEMA
jgi:glycolate oxidase FAD binding subunit